MKAHLPYLLMGETLSLLHVQTKLVTMDQKDKVEEAVTFFTQKKLEENGTGRLTFRAM